MVVTLSVCVDMDDDQWDENFPDSFIKEVEPKAMMVASSWI